MHSLVEHTLDEDFGTSLTNIYSDELSIKKESTHEDRASYLYLCIEVQNKHIYTKMYDKHDSFNFDIVNYPFV